MAYKQELTLWQLCFTGKVEDARAAVARGEDVNSSGGWGISALMWAVRNKLNSIVSLLLEQPGLEVNMKDGLGLTALHWAAVDDNPDAVPLLLDDPRVDVNCRSDIGRTHVRDMFQKC